jgi:hypothetical protein
LSTGRHSHPVPGPEQFPSARNGYQRAAVDDYTADVRQRLDRASEDLAALSSENQRLRSDLDVVQREYEQFSATGVADRVRQILSAAEAQAQARTENSVRDAEQRVERVEFEIQRMRQTATAELDEVKSRELTEIEQLRRAGEQDAVDALAKAQAEAERSLDAARLHAAAIVNQAEHQATAAVRTADLEAQRIVDAAEKEAAMLRQQTAERREADLAKLSTEHERAGSATRALLAEATERHRQSAEHIAEETQLVSRMRQQALAEVEQRRVRAIDEAEAIVSRARQQAITIEERARQEFAWRRRQMRQEYELLSERKQAMLSELPSLNALAEAAEKLAQPPETSVLRGLDEQAQAPEQRGS